MQSKNKHGYMFCTAVSKACIITPFILIAALFGCMLGYWKQENSDVLLITIISMLSITTAIYLGLVYRVKVRKKDNLHKQ